MTCTTILWKDCYLDEATDQAIIARSDAKDLPRAEVFGRLLAAGLKAVRNGHERPTLVPEELPLVLRRVLMDTELFETIRVEAFDRRTGWSRVMLEYLAVGLKLARAEGEAGGP